MQPEGEAAERCVDSQPQRFARHKENWPLRRLHSHRVSHFSTKQRHRNVAYLIGQQRPQSMPQVLSKSRQKPEELIAFRAIRCKHHNQ